MLLRCLEVCCCCCCCGSRKGKPARQGVVLKQRAGLSHRLLSICALPRSPLRPSLMYVGECIDAGSGSSSSSSSSSSSGKRGELNRLQVGERHYLKVPSGPIEPQASSDSTRCSNSSSSSNSSSNSSSSSSSLGLEAKQRARLKRQFVRTPWLDINKAPSWPPIKKNKFLDSDWKIVDFRPQTPETKRSRLFLNSLCYLCEGVITKKSTLGRKAGLGLFCSKSDGFAKGAVITEFVGWLVDREQAEQLRNKRRASHIVAVQKGFLYIDGVKEPYYGTGGASFANDGSEFLGGPGNNSIFYHWFDEELGRTRVFLRATRDIANGEEIFVPYDKTYWQDNFEEQEENCPDAFRKKKIEQLQRKYKDFTITSMEDLKARQALLEQQRRAKQEKVKAGKKKPPKPNVKRPLSAFMRFSVGRRRELVAANPELRHPKCFKEIAQRISHEWKELGAQKKQEFEQQAAADFNKYKQKVREWRAKHAPKSKRKQKKNAKARNSQPAPATPAHGAESAADEAETDAKAERLHTEAAAEAVGGEKTGANELHQRDVKTQSQEPNAANAATDVPESTVDSSSNSRQSSVPEAPDATGANRFEDKKEAPAAAIECASTTG